MPAASILPALALFLAFCLGLVLAGTWLVKSLSVISRFLRVREFVLAFFLMAVSTSLPELFVGITSAIAKNSSLALGTVIGSNIADLSLVAGVLFILARKVHIHDARIVRDAYWLIAVAALPMVLMAIGNGLSRIDGAILLVAFVLYGWTLIRDRKHKDVRKKSEMMPRKDVILSPLIFLASIALLFWSAENVVHYGGILAQAWNLPPILIGLVIVALGTSLPELAFEGQAALRNHPDLGLGDLLGSVMCNSLLVLGITAFIWPIQARFAYFLTSAVFMVFTCVLFAVFASYRMFTWRMGIVFILLYVVFIVFELGLRGVIPVNGVLGIG